MLSARRVIENTFGILVSRLKIFHRPTIASVDNVKFITKAAAVLHDFVIKTQSNSCGFDFCPPYFIDQENGSVEIPGQWRKEVADVQGMVQLNSQC